jgi:hypothetical protein
MGAEIHRQYPQKCGDDKQRRKLANVRGVRNVFRASFCKKNVAPQNVIAQNIAAQNVIAHNGIGLDNRVTNIIHEIYTTPLNKKNTPEKIFSPASSQHLVFEKGNHFFGNAFCRGGILPRDQSPVGNTVCLPWRHRKGTLTMKTFAILVINVKTSSFKRINT